MYIPTHMGVSKFIRQYMKEGVLFKRFISHIFVHGFRLCIMLALSRLPFSMRLVMLNTGIPSLVYRRLYVSRPCSTSLVFTISLSIGAVRYSTSNFDFLPYFCGYLIGSSGLAPVSTTNVFSNFGLVKSFYCIPGCANPQLVILRYLSAISASTRFKES